MVNVNMLSSIQAKPLAPSRVAARQAVAEGAMLRFGGVDTVDFLDDATLSRLKPWVDEQADQVIELLREKTYDGVSLATIFQESRNTISAFNKAYYDRNPLRRFLDSQLSGFAGRGFDRSYPNENELRTRLAQRLGKDGHSASPVSHALTNLKDLGLIESYYRKNLSLWGEYVMGRMEGRTDRSFPTSFWKEKLKEYNQKQSLL